MVTHVCAERVILAHEFITKLRLLIAAQVLSCCVNICLLFSSRTSTFLVDIAVDCLAERSHEVMSGTTCLLSVLDYIPLGSPKEDL